METQTIIFIVLVGIGMLGFGFGFGVLWLHYSIVTPLIDKIATMRKEGYISVVPAEPRPDYYEPWMEIAEL